MQVPYRVRETIAGNGATADLAPIDVQSMPLLVLAMIAHSLTGTSPVLTVQMQTSEDLESWVNFGSTLTLSAQGTDREPFLLTSTPYGRYVRVQLTLAGGATPTACYSLYLNTYASS